ncbi:MAG: bifunctional phosphopantothenoylcysteine decarboxylase/phosphopantothenate--cysteine ligase CoaBC [Hydrotalea flava]|uniref:bifunctional phosphopantothenoylcysteine decarboxylase/phosphopantothenate--cysteine ligase CoaBC n=1 Tax=Hydrotalea TaxID=1004300 RepID=UPI0009449EBC|nr:MULTISPECIES: bifunctional phosphopantothenoylcysteine decarboxylase/phosphopantothenate--cysteine ligase CoaBC [Hydrotalea]MBY0347947.1 bifunctional phosphopantothenoylcysteine decarboxylase/phosphopantothenate--cysteine ligase CoaBC [Hydrotalea flava]RWZ90237.1 MAG: bifunctional phosphopantothenoylcysteine decarboxylase/phosphopantothenate--cysteine ligase CoaBC [Hydrotalea sp. AMD]
MLKGKKILIGITGSIAAYKVIYLVRLLVKSGAEVKVIMTASAKNFVSPLVLETLSKNAVLENLTESSTWANHVALGRWADVFLIAPLSANSLAKIANGICDNLLMAVYLSATCPVVAAPAMDEDMWLHPATKRNIQHAASDGVHFIPIENGELASGLVGEGRMAEPETIVNFLISQFFRGTLLKNKTVLVTAGPTYEPIDPVRFIGNHSSGKMGFAIAEACYLEGANVVLITGPTALYSSFKEIKLVHITTANELLEQCMIEARQAQIIIMNAAVADYTPLKKETQKIKKGKNESEWLLPLVKTIDILALLGKQKTAHQYIMGFALETEQELKNSLEKLNVKKIDSIVLNSLNDAQAGFGYDTNQITIISKNGRTEKMALKSKTELAKDIVLYISEELDA